MNLSLVVHTDSIPTEASSPTPALRPFDTLKASATPSDILGSLMVALPPRPTTASRTLTTNASLLWMGHLAFTTNFRAARIETSIPVIVQTVVANVVTSFTTTIYALNNRIMVCEYRQGATEEVMSLSMMLLS